MRTFNSLVVGVLASAIPVIAGVHEQWWNLTYVENANPDGLFERRVIGVNGTWPPPPVDVNTTDSLLVHVTNSLDDVATLHHHGMFFNSTSWMDGALGVTECGIPPGGTFDYVVPIDTSGQWGTYWVHAHSKGQYVDGLRAPVVLHPPREVHGYDEEFTVVLGDWYHDEHPVLLDQFINIANPGGAEPVPDSALVYFAQNASYLGPISGTNPHLTTAAVGFNENATLPFEPGKTYRLRIVNTSGFAAFFFWIDGHIMRIIEVDGTDIEESPIDLISVTVAQRYSVLVTARNDTTANWAIHANMDVDMFDTIPDALNPNVTTSITYNASAPLTDLGFVGEYHDVNDLDLVPIEVIPQPAASRTIELEVIFDTMDDGTNHAMFNQITYNTPLVPTIFSELSLGDNATAEQAYGPLHFVLDHMEVVDIVIKNGDAGKHPFHLHGHKPMLVGRSEDYTSDDPALNPPIREGQANPMRRDTVQIPSMHSATLRVVADNPGVWFLHCHIEWHLEVGLAISLVEAPLEAQKRNTVPQSMYDNCRALNMPFSGNAAGFASTTQLVGLPLGPYPQNNGWHGKGIGAMFGCVLSAVLGMATATWYTLGGQVSEEEEESERAIKLKISANVPFTGYTAFDEFAIIALQSGLVKSLISLAQLDEQDRERGSAAYQAGDTFARLMITGDIEQRRSLLKDLINYDVVTLLLKKLSHPLCIQRQLSANLMRTLAGESFLGELISAQRAADTMEKYCQHTLDGPDLFIEQLTSPNLSWQCEIAVGKEMSPIHARKYAPRYYALSQENSMWTTHALLCRDPPASYQFRRDLLRHKPQVIDLLFKCGALPVQPWYPENQHDSIACETLTLLFMPSLDHISGVPIPLKDARQSIDDADTEAFNECLDILFSRDNWVELLVNVWKRLDDERWQDTLQLFQRVVRDHLAVQSPDESSFSQVFEYRGTSRICILRIIATLTYSANASSITDADLLALLRIAYLGCQRAQAAKTPQMNSPKQDIYASVEALQEIAREPLYTRSVPQGIEAPQITPPLGVMGPLALTRVLTLLAKRGLLEKISSWQRLPKGTSKSVSLRQVQQITSHTVLDKSLRYAMKITVARKEQGTDRMRRGKIEEAGTTYMSSAELAAALLAFDECTDGKWSNRLACAREELVKSLGNASEMAFQRKKYRRALRFATGAVSIGEGAPSSKPIDSALIAKNKRRMEVSGSQVKA